MEVLKKVYSAVTKDVTEDKLLNLEEKWGSKYPVVIESWQRNWEQLSLYFEHTEPIRKIIYTTNAVEGFHRQIRKVPKTKGALLMICHYSNWSTWLQETLRRNGSLLCIIGALRSSNFILNLETGYHWMDINANSSGASPRGIETSNRV